MKTVRITSPKAFSTVRCCLIHESIRYDNLSGRFDIFFPYGLQSVTEFLPVGYITFVLQRKMTKLERNACRLFDGRVIFFLFGRVYIKVGDRRLESPILGWLEFAVPPYIV